MNHKLINPSWSDYVQKSYQNISVWLSIPTRGAFPKAFETHPNLTTTLAQPVHAIHVHKINEVKLVLNDLRDNE